MTLNIDMFQLLEDEEKLETILETERLNIQNALNFKKNHLFFLAAASRAMARASEARE